MGDRVRIVVTAETEELGLAGKIGDVRGQTRPSSSQVTVVGSVVDDYAIAVHFAET
jgi:hypothetical protein